MNKVETSALATQVGGGHYKKLAIQPVQYCHANGIGFMEGSAIKYLTRWRDKGGVEDLKKARHFIDLLIELEEQAKLDAQIEKIIEGEETLFGFSRAEVEGDPHLADMRELHHEVTKVVGSDGSVEHAKNVAPSEAPPQEWPPYVHPADTFSLRAYQDQFAACKQPREILEIVYQSPWELTQAQRRQLYLEMVLALRQCEGAEHEVWREWAVQFFLAARAHNWPRLLLCAKNIPLSPHGRRVDFYECFDADFADVLAIASTRWLDVERAQAAKAESVAAKTGDSITPEKPPFVEYDDERPAQRVELAAPISESVVDKLNSEILAFRRDPEKQCLNISAEEGLRAESEARKVLGEFQALDEARPAVDPALTVLV
jgi:Protein of unknwon function (DUF3310)